MIEQMIVLAGDSFLGFSLSLSLKHTGFFHAHPVMRLVLNLVGQGGRVLVFVMVVHGTTIVVDKDGRVETRIEIFDRYIK